MAELQFWRAWSEFGRRSDFGSLFGTGVCGGVLRQWWGRRPKVGGFWKVVDRRVTGRSLGGCGGLWQWEFRKGKAVVSV